MPFYKLPLYTCTFQLCYGALLTFQGPISYLTCCFLLPPLHLLISFSHLFLTPIFNLPLTLSNFDCHLFFCPLQLFLSIHLHSPLISFSFSGWLSLMFFRDVALATHDLGHSVLHFVSVCACRCVCVGVWQLSDNMSVPARASGKVIIVVLIHNYIKKILNHTAGDDKMTEPNS